VCEWRLSWPCFSVLPQRPSLTLRPQLGGVLLSLVALWEVSWPPRVVRKSVSQSVNQSVSESAGDGESQMRSLPSDQGHNAAPQLAERVGRKTVARFWEILQDAATLGYPDGDKRWQHIPQGHAYLEFRGNKLAVNLTSDTGTVVPVLDA
jgi:hypothetical protein